MAINVSVQYNGGSFPRHYTVDPRLLPLGNPFKCHEEVVLSDYETTIILELYNTKSLRACCKT